VKEEAVRQEYLRVLHESYGYPDEVLETEVPIPRGSAKRPDRADIVVYRDGEQRDPASDILGIVETKRPSRTDGVAQLKSYMTATSSEWGVWTNGEDITYLCRAGARILEGHLNDIPAHGQSVDDVGRLQKSTLKPFHRTALKAGFRRILLTLYANTNISRREKLGNEMIKLIFCKIEDERTYPNRPPAFRAEPGENPETVARRIDDLFRRVLADLREDGVFSEYEKITLDARSVAWVVGQLQTGSLSKTNTDVVGDAFEVFAESRFVGEKGEFFTPRNVVRVAVKIANPQPDTTICDPACGSGGFLIIAMKHVWSLMAEDPKWKGSSELRDQQRQMTRNSFFGIDKESDLVKIAKAHMAIAGDGRTNIVHENALHRPVEFIGDAKKLFTRSGRLRQFDFIMTNPPFGTKTKVHAADARQFELGHKWSKRPGGKWTMNDVPIDRDSYVLFIERCLQMLKEGGTLSIVLPETVFHGIRAGYLRQKLLQDNGVVAIIDLPHNTFRPHCNAKTCLLILTKGMRRPDSVLMGTPKEMGHDHQGKTIYREHDSEAVWDDMACVEEELDHPDDSSNRYVFRVPWSDVRPNALVPRFYRREHGSLPTGRVGVTVGGLIEEGIIATWDGHGSPSGVTEKGAGDIPYIRVSDIVNWELYRNPVSGITEETYVRLGGHKKKPAPGDVIFVRRGSYRIGTVAMASPRDEKVLLTRELLTMRVIAEHNKYALTPFYLLALLSSTYVQEQLYNLVFYDTTMPNIGDRWKLLVLPIHSSPDEAAQVGSTVEDSIRAKWEAQERIDLLRQKIGGLVT